MTPIFEIAQLDRAITAVRHRASAYTTNFFCDRNWLTERISRQCLGAIEFDDVVLICRKDTTFTQIYFAAAGPEALEARLAESWHQLPRPAVVDLIGPQSSIGPLTDLFVKRGFRTHERLRRMVRTLPLDGTQSETPVAARQSGFSVEPALEADADWIEQRMQSDFDRFVDQLPLQSDLLHTISEGRVLICRVDSQSAGFLLYERNGSTGLVKYWYVDAAYRGHGVGSALMNRFAQTRPVPKRILLWVKEHNKTAIDRYVHYRFQWEGLFDHVLVLEEIDR